MQMSLRLLIVSCIFAALTPSLLFGQKQQAPLPIEDAVGALSFGDGGRIPIDVSPDGKVVAYTLQDLRRKQPGKNERYSFLISQTGALTTAEGCDIWIADTKTGESSNITGGEGNNWGPKWSPDGQYLAFYSDRAGKANLWVWNRDSKGLRKISDALIRASFGDEIVNWTANSQKILVKLLPEGMSAEDIANLLWEPPRRTRDNIRAPNSTVTIYDSRDAELSALNWTNNNLGDLALIDIPRGKIQRLTRGLKISHYSLSPDNSRVVFTTPKGHEGLSSQYLFDINVISLSDARPRVVAENIRHDGRSVSWSPDGKFLSYTTSGPYAKGGDCYVVSIDEGKSQNLTQGPHLPLRTGKPKWDVGGNNIYLIASNTVLKASLADGKAAPLATISGRTIIGIVSQRENGFWSSDYGRSVFVQTFDDETKQQGFYRVDTTGGSYSAVFEESKSFSSNLDAAAGTVIVIAEDIQHGPDLWAYDADFRHSRQLTRINPQFDKYAMGRSRLIRWRGADGQTLQGALLLPANYEEGKQYPLVVKVYGGAPLSNALNRFGLSPEGHSDNKQILATRGYAVLCPDSSTRLGTPMRDIAQTVLPGVNQAIELGIADPQRLGVMGTSYGGYSALALIVQTTRFKAAVMNVGIGNVLTFYNNMENFGRNWGSSWAETGQGNLGGTPWDYRERYIENSPYFYLDRVQTPLLINYGTFDFGLPQQLSVEVFLGLRRLGKEVVMAKYEGEGHGIGIDWAYANQIDYVTRLINWFDRHLKNANPETRTPSQ
jgi:dipeptidyl aminopeptidase/acylaminoacyl peptidase